MSLRHARLLILVLLCALSIPVRAMPAGRQAEEPAAAAVALTLEEVVALAITNSLDVRLAELDRERIRTRLEESRAPFDTLLSLSTSYELDEKENASRVVGTRSTEALYDLSLEKRLTTGTTVEVAWTNSRTSTNSTFSTLNPAFASGLEARVTQALGSNFAGLVDRAKLRVTELEVRQDDLAAVDRIEEAVARAVSRYWDLAGAMERLRMRQAAYDRADALHRANQEKQTLGLIEEPERLASLANLKRREEEVWVARNELASARRALAVELDLPQEWRVQPATSLSVPLPQPPAMSESLAQAASARRDLRQAQLAVEASRLQVKLKANERFPTVDLTASFKANGLEVKYDESLNEIANGENPTSFLGLEVSWPLENREARSAWRRAQVEKVQALVRLHRAQRLIAQAVDEAVRRVRLARAQVDQRQEIEALHRRRLNEEGDRFRLGRSNVQTFIDVQTDLIEAQEALADALVGSQQAWMALRRAEHVLLAHYGYLPAGQAGRPER